MIDVLFFSIALLLKPSQSLTVFQSGLIEVFYVWQTSHILYTSQTPNRSSQYSQIFPATFPNIPEVFLVLDKFDLDPGNEQGYQLYIMDITTLGFTVNIQLPYSTVFDGIKFRYYAIYDQRRQVISMLNQFNPSSGITKFSHKNPNYAVGIASLTSIQYQGWFDYHIYVQEVTRTDCTVSISLSNSITQIGYQILLGTKDAFQIKATIYATSFPFQVDPFNLETGWENSYLLAVFQGVSYPSGITFRLQIIRSSLSDSETGHKIDIWWDSVLSSTYHQYGLIRSQWDVGFYSSFKLDKIFISKNFNLNIESVQNTFELTIPELNFSTNVQGIYNFDISSSISDITVILTRKCQQEKQLIVRAVPENNCASPYYQYNINCESKHNICNQKLYFSTPTPLISKLKVDITQDIEFKIVHNYIDYTEMFVEILNIQYV